MRQTSLLALITLLISSTGLFAGKQELPEAQVRFFETRIRPLLVERCQSCHGAEKQRGGLRLDSGSAILKGGYTGPAVIPNKPQDSLLLRAIDYQDPDLKMPPKNQLSARQIADVRQWVEMGAPFPADTRVTAPAPNEARTFWAFIPPLDPPLPPVKDANWAQTPIDTFLLAKLEASQLAPAPPADRRTLLRRVTYDLIGLPPTPEEVDAFLADDSPDAFARVVDRLLASPQYGERWGRHWLDVARYADSNGLDENLAYGNAWRYRDYVVEAFNRDKPYDRFVVEQLAGDLVPEAGIEGKVATGFLSLGPKVLAEPDETKMEMDIIDEQMDTLGRAFLAMTVGCARCHDHKFDPLTQEDYYGLAGIFKSTKTMEHFKKIARWHEHVIVDPVEEKRLREEHARQVESTNQKINQLVAKTNADLTAKLEPGKSLPKTPEPMYPEPVKAELKRLRAEVKQLEKAGPDLPTALGVAEREVVNLPIHLRGSHLSLGKVVERRFPQFLADDASSLSGSTSGRLELAKWLVQPDHPLTARVMVNRLWRWHFGRGLVGTPDNFGKLGEKPTHPALLDWLAHRFIESGWSIKSMHRLILLSSAYQMSSDQDPTAEEADPDNLLWHRFPVRRLEAEPIRDALLFVSGNLDRAVGGTLLTHVKNREFLFDHTSKDGTTYQTGRRSLYIPVIRNHLYDMFQLFDFPDSLVLNGDRATTTVAPQALFLLNGEFVMETSEQLARKVLAEEKTDADRITLLYRTAFSRPPTTVERKTAIAMLANLKAASALRESDEAGADVQAWAWFCHTLLAANEFIYVR